MYIIFTYARYSNKLLINSGEKMRKVDVVWAYVFAFVNECSGSKLGIKKYTSRKKKDFFAQ